MLSQNRDQNLVPDYGYIFWTFYQDHFMKVQNLDLGLKVLILQEGPQRSMKDHIGTMVMFYIRSLFYSISLALFFTVFRQPQINSKQKKRNTFYLIVSFSSFKIFSIRTSLSALTPSLSAVDARSSADRRRRFRLSPLSSLPSNMAPSWWLAVVGVPKKCNLN